MEQSPTTSSAEFLSANRSVDQETEDELFILASQAMDQGESDGDLHSDLRESEAIQQEEEEKNTGVTEEGVKSTPVSQISYKTLVQTSWSSGLWTTWAKQRKKLPQEDGEECQHELLTDINSMRVEDLAFWLGKFILEVRRQTDGKPYPVDTLCNIVAGLNRSLKYSGREENFVRDPVFAGFRGIFATEKKRVRAATKRKNNMATVSESLNVSNFPQAIVPAKSTLQDVSIPASQQINEVVCGGRKGETELSSVTGVAKKTLAQTAWCDRIWSTWASQRMNLPPADTEERLHSLLTDFKSMEANDMAFWLGKFILEIRRSDGDPYSPESLNNILAGLGRILKYSGRTDIDLMRDPAFLCCRGVRDTVLCQLRSTGNYPRKTASVIGTAEENTLWEKGLLGDHTSHVLIDTLVYYIGYCFGIRGGYHRKLRHKPSQLELFEPPGAGPYLVYTEDLSEGNSQRTKLVLEKNMENPKRCLVRLYKLYNSKCPANRPDEAFYLRPLVQPKGNIWYDSAPMGHNVLSRTIHRLFASAGIEGNYTHHSLRATSASRFYYPGMDEHQVAQAYTSELGKTGIQCKRIGNRDNAMPALNTVVDGSPSKKPKLGAGGSQAEVDGQENIESQATGPETVRIVIARPNIAAYTASIGNSTRESVGPETAEPEIVYIENSKQESVEIESAEPAVVYIENAKQQSLRPETVGQYSVNMETAGIEISGLETGEPEITSVENVGQESAEPETANIDTSGLETTRPWSMGPDSEQDTAGLEGFMLKSAGFETTGPENTEPDSAGSDREVFVCNTDEYEENGYDVDQDFHSPEPKELASQQYRNIMQSGGNTKSRFCAPVSSVDVLESTSANAMEKSTVPRVPQRTMVQTTWCTGIWSTWAIQRQQRSAADSEETKHQLLPDFTAMTGNDIAFWLTKFFLEIRRTDGKPYTPDSLYSIFAGLNRGLKYSGRPQTSLMRDPLFSSCRDVLEAEMARLHNTGKFYKKSVTVIGAAEENILWEKGLLGDHTPQALIDTLIYYIGYYFAICGGEHRKLRHEPSQLQLFEPPGDVPYLMYTEDATGGRLKRHKKRSVYTNGDNPERCLVRLYKLYNSKCPLRRPKDAFYLRPMTEPQGDVWYETIPMGHNLLSKAIPRLFKRAGIEGNYTNLSLRAAARPATTRIDEHLIKARSGHSSTADVLSSKRIPERENEFQFTPVAVGPPTKRLKLAFEENQAEAAGCDSDEPEIMESGIDRPETPGSDSGALEESIGSETDIESDEPRSVMPEIAESTRPQTARSETESRSARLGAGIAAAVLKNFGIDTTGLETVLSEMAELKATETGTAGSKKTRLQTMSIRPNNAGLNITVPTATPNSAELETAKPEMAGPSTRQNSSTRNESDEAYNSASENVGLDATGPDTAEYETSQPTASESHTRQQTWSNVHPDTLATILQHNGPPIIITGGLTINFNFK